MEEQATWSSRWWAERKLGDKIFTVFLAVGMGLIIVAMAVFVGVVRHELNVVAEEKVAAASGSVKKQLEEEGMRLERVVSIFGNSSTLGESLYYFSVSGDRGQVSSEMRGLFERFPITLLTVADGGGKVAFRVHSPDDFGDGIGETTLGAAGLGGKRLSGFYSDKSGPALRAGGPVLSGGEVIGYVEAGNFLGDEFAAGLENLTGASVTFYVDGKPVASSFGSGEGKGEGEGIVIETLAGELVSEVAAASSLVLRDEGIGGVSYLSTYSPLNTADGAAGIMMRVSVDKSSIQNIQSKILVVSFFIILIGAVAVYFTARYFSRTTITEPLHGVTDKLEAIGTSWDLTQKISVNGRTDEVGDLGNWFNKFIDKLGDVIGTVKTSTFKVDESVSEISAAIKEQAAIAAQQSASVAEITSTMEELSTTATQIADNTKWVVEYSENAEKSAEKGSSAVERVMSKMNDISADNDANMNEIIDLGKKSSEITKVMEIINNIADQTKLIAFNAAIEASGAGEAGKRFGVVAVEIRRLADNVMESTGEIEGKIKEIQDAVNRLVMTSERGSKGVKEGISEATETVTLLGSILSGAQTTSESARQIALSTQQQKTASTQVVTALKEIAGGVKQYSASISQTDTTTSGLADLSEMLKETVDRFKV